jgi:hypothetical protein
MACSKQGILVIWGAVNELQKARQLCAGEDEILAELGEIEMALFNLTKKIADIVERKQTFTSILPPRSFVIPNQLAVNGAAELDVAVG